MGCDIHLYVERRDNGNWISADEWIDEYGDGFDVPCEKSFYATRCYSLFAILANVRNGEGFAGCDLGDGYRPISEPKGLPEDVSPEVAASSERWNGDGHSHSWHTLADLLSYDWTQVTERRGVVNGPEFLDWVTWRRGDGLGPKNFSGDVFGVGIVHVTLDKMEQLIAPIDSETFGDHETRVKRDLARTYCRVFWNEPYYRSASLFLSECLPRLLHLGKPEDVRIVFWFDN